ncbi:hypothetical protein PybrP1_005356 [[Pythium] brassicae (nom. inval.)]|nr:hypothetical protein PybrP1_005356 [[Pythium] brassicae (nom. inval.)]
MDALTLDAHRQLSCFLSLSDDDEMAQMILEELSFPRRSYMNDDREENGDEDDA